MFWGKLPYTKEQRQIFQRHFTWQNEIAKGTSSVIDVVLGRWFPK